MFEKIPPPPTSVKDAFSKVTTYDENGKLRCSAEKLFASIEEEVGRVEAESAGQSKAGAGSVAPEAAPKTKKKVKAMSKEEKKYSPISIHY